MSSNVHYLDFPSHDVRALQEILRRAGYITSRMEPLAGVKHEASKSLIARFKSAVPAE